MKNFQKFIAVFVVFFGLVCTFAGAQELPAPIPVPGGGSTDHYSWALPLADTMSYARQAVRWVSASTRAKTILDASARRQIEFEFISPRADGVVMANDINVALATNQLDLIVAESENVFDGKITLKDSAFRPLFTGEFRVHSPGGGDVSVAVTYWLSSEIEIPVPEDLKFVEATYLNAWGGEQTFLLFAQSGWLRVPTYLGNKGTAKATFKGGSQINFSLSTGTAEGEKGVRVTIKGEFAHTLTFATGETTIVLGVEQWMLNNQQEFTAIFEPAEKMVLLYAEIPNGQQAATSVRLRSLSHGVLSQPFTITPGQALSINLYDVLGAFPQKLGVWEAIFSFPTGYYYGGYSSTTGAPIPVTIDEK